MIKHKEQAELSRATLKIYSSIYSELPLQKRVTDLRNIKFKTKFKVVFHLRSSVIWGCVQLEFFLNLLVVLDWGPSFIWGHLPLKVVFQQRLSSNGGCLPMLVVFHWRLTCIGGCIPLKVVFHWRHLHWRSSYIGGCHPLEVKCHSMLSHFTWVTSPGAKFLLWETLE